ncbi:MmcQ/YjbR family DNA-binding protein [Dactylosporangium sp. AC04546]|uniref:MmcQ/YjbR family DNA-binding protein n=1 Tax=Dactylosporangium sp. AC04546 TaxID=2862460 RepID=UPI001EDFB316|nr:MmcQ/YjbR family DNA-binding protein [Dactylosporangium sp. AC04546]WVK81563.1 MmcQ/YjbR family DNA-binding protein [Dactylosporangium sp. AC04546]
MVSVDEVRAVARRLPRAYEVLVRDRVKWRVGQIVFAAMSRDETVIGFGYPKEERAARVAAEPDVFLMPDDSDLRFNWICARMEALDGDRMRELVEDAWMMCVPKKVWTEFLARNPR